MNKISFKCLVVATICFYYAENLIAQSITGGQSFTMALCQNGVINGVGNNFSGQLGNGNSQFANFNTVQTVGLSNIVAINTGLYHTLFLKNDGTVYATGRNNQGQLGDGTLINRNIPLQISGLSNIIAISGGNNFSLFLKNDGTVWAVGGNGFGQLGDNTLIDKNIPIKINALSGIVAIAAGELHCLFLRSNGTVWACGRNNFGQLGNGLQSQFNSTPFEIPNLTNVTALDAGGSFSVFLKNNGFVWASGEGGYGQLGNSSFGSSVTIPTQVLNLSGITALKTGIHHALFQKNDGTIWGVGYNSSGCLGDGTFLNKNIPIQIPGFTNVLEIGCGDFHSIFRKNDNTIWVTGSNDSGQLGNGTNISSNIPIQVSNFCNGILATNKVSKDNSVHIYPNPCNDNFYINLKENAQLRIYNLQGQLLQSNQLTIGQNNINLNNLSKGIYLLHLQFTHISIIEKITKE